MSNAATKCECVVSEHQHHGHNLIIYLLQWQWYACELCGSCTRDWVNWWYTWILLLPHPFLHQYACCSWTQVYWSRQLPQYIACHFINILLPSPTVPVQHHNINNISIAIGWLDHANLSTLDIGVKPWIGRSPIQFRLSPQLFADTAQYNITPTQ